MDDIEIFLAARVLNLNEADLLRRLTQYGEKQFLWIKRRMDDDRADAVRRLKLPPDIWGFREEFLRTDGINQTWVQVIERPKSELGGDVMVSLGPSKKFTPCRHSGALEEEREVA